WGCRVDGHTLMDVQHELRARLEASMDDRRAGTRMLPDYRAGALRSRLISRLTGLTPRQLSYWHRSALIPAHAAPGAPGRPRLYSWVDYLKLRDAAKLRAARAPTPASRRAGDYQEAMVPEGPLGP